MKPASRIPNFEPPVPVIDLVEGEFAKAAAVLPRIHPGRLLIVYHVPACQAVGIKFLNGGLPSDSVALKAPLLVAESAEQPAANLAPKKNL